MSDAQKPLPDRLLIFRRVGSDRPHVGEDGETMSWANADGQAYIHADLHEALQSENERLRAVLEAITKDGHDLQAIQEEAGTDANRYNFLAARYFAAELGRLKEIACAALKGETP